jgi:hypothetical protein
MTDCICKLCLADVQPLADQCGNVFVLDKQPARPAEDPKDRGRYVLTGSLVWTVVADGEVLVEGDGRMHEAEAFGLQRFNLHALRHAPPSKRPPSQEVTRDTGARKRRPYVR